MLLINKVGDYTWVLNNGTRLNLNKLIGEHQVGVHNVFFKTLEMIETEEVVKKAIKNSTAVEEINKKVLRMVRGVHLNAEDEVERQEKEKERQRALDAERERKQVEALRVQTQEEERVRLAAEKKAAAAAAEEDAKSRLQEQYVTMPLITVRAYETPETPFEALCGIYKYSDNPEIGYEYNGNSLRYLGDYTFQIQTGDTLYNSDKVLNPNILEINKITKMDGFKSLTIKIDDYELVPHEFYLIYNGMGNGEHQNRPAFDVNFSEKDIETAFGKRKINRNKNDKKQDSNNLIWSIFGTYILQDDLTFKKRILLAKAATFEPEQNADGTWRPPLKATGNKIPATIKINKQISLKFAETEYSYFKIDTSDIMKDVKSTPTHLDIIVTKSIRLVHVTLTKIK